MVGTPLLERNYHFNELVETLRKESDDRHGYIDGLIVESIKETIEAVFGIDVSKIVEDILGIESMEGKIPFDADGFIDKLNDVFGKDAYHLNMMAQGKILTKYHHIKLRKKIDGPVKFSPKIAE